MRNDGRRHALTRVLTVFGLALAGCGGPEALHGGRDGGSLGHDSSLPVTEPRPDGGAPDVPVTHDGPTTTPTCTDRIKNGSETDTDCGGSCPKCQVGLACVLPGDCANGVCTGGFCQPAGCGDNILNGTETALDCGGKNCAPCTDGKACLVTADCQSHVCTNAVCQAPTCMDTLKNGSESDTDCGGTCPKCAKDAICNVAADCASGVCNGHCQSESCGDGVKNGSESDVDCGGTCSRCADGKTCAAATDCTSGVCSTTCQVAGCTDKVKNGAETAIDCGGGKCPGCATGSACLVNGDCMTNLCAGGTCQAVSCTDGMKNGTETDVDCGGSCARQCDVFKGCLVNADCTTNICTAGSCRSPWRVQYRAQVTMASTQQIQPFFQIISSGGATAPLSEFTLRYWYTQDVAQAQAANCDYALIGNGNVTFTFAAVTPARTGADTYMQVGFAAGAGSLVGGTSSGEIQTRIHDATFAAYTQTGDYSYDPTKTAYADWDHVTLYHNGALVWGVEPP
jgi:hypothetical protein